MKTIAYLRVSTIEQNIEKNRHAILHLANEKNHEVKAYLRGQLSGVKTEEFNKQIHQLGAVL